MTGPRLFILAYGPAFLDLLEQVAVRSLLQDRNRDALPLDAVVSLHTDERSRELAEQIVGHLGLTGETTLWTTSAGVTPGEIQQTAIMAEMRRCLADDAPLVMVPPDTFWGDGSLGTLLAIGEQPRVCVSAPHVRVNRAEMLAALAHISGSIENAHLVGLSMRTLHQTWLDADVTRARTNSWWSGTTIRALGDGLYAVQHRLPTIYLARFVPSDLAFFREHDKLGLWDHRWPAIVVAADRQRVICSSDGFFAAELTAAEENRPIVQARNDAEPDAYRGDLDHHRVNRNAVSIWRSA